MNKKSKINSVVMAVVVGASALVGAVGHYLIASPEVIVETNTVTETVVQTVEVPVKGDDVIQYVEKLVEVPVVDNDLVRATCDRLLFDDLAECKEEVMAEDEALVLALDIVNDDDFFDMLEDEGIVRDEDRVEVIKVYDDFEDINILKSNFDNDKYKFSFEVKVEDTRLDEKHKVLVTVLVEDGEVELKNVEV